MVKMKIIIALILLVSFNCYAKDSTPALQPEKQIPIVQGVSFPIETNPVVEKLWKGNETRLIYSDFLTMLDEDKIKTIITSVRFEESHEFRIITRNNERFITIGYLNEKLIDLIRSKKIRIETVKDFTIEQPNNVTESDKRYEYWKNVAWSIVSSIQNIIGFVLLILLLVYVQYKGMGLFSKGRNRRVKSSDLKVSFTDIAGIDEAKRDVMEVVDFFNNKEDYNHLGAKLPRGILLIGEPGNGKTMLAKAIAKECNAVFDEASGSEFTEVFAGVGASRIRSMFKNARKAKRAIIFIDEIDSIGRKRGTLNSHGESEQTLNELLVQMDGFQTKDADVLVIAATNRVDALDEALLRPGRFDRIIAVNKPNQKGREDILRVYLSKTKEFLEENINIQSLAQQTVGFSGAELANLVNEALIRAGKRKAKKVEYTDLIDAREKLILGDPRHDIGLLEKEKRVTAIHESGHTIIALSSSCIPVEKVTIVPRRDALGLMLQVPEREVFNHSKEELISRIQVMMGGRAAEEIITGQFTTGASNDMSRAFDLARQMILMYGMGKTLGAAAVTDINKISEQLKNCLEKEAVVLVNQCYSEARSIIIKNKEKLNKLTEKLIKKETLNKNEILEIWKN